MTSERRYFQIVVLALVAVVVYFPLRAALRIAAVVRGSETYSAGASPPPARTATVGSNERSGERAISPDNLSKPTGVSTSDPLSWPDCDGVQVSIISESSDPSWSLTTLRETGRPRARLRRVGDEVGGKQVAFIGFNPKQQVPSVWLQGTGAFCQATLRRQPPFVDVAPAQIARATVEKAITNPLSLMGSLRVVPERKGGEVIGLRLLGLRPGALLSQLGLRNGDRLESINGFSVASPEKALEAYARLRTASRLSVRVSRASQPLEIILNIR